MLYLILIAFSTILANRYVVNLGTKHFSVSAVIESLPDDLLFLSDIIILIQFSVTGDIYIYIEWNGLGLEGGGDEGTSILFAKF